MKISKMLEKSCVTHRHHSKEGNFNCQIIYMRIDFQSNSISEVYDQSSVKFLSHQVIVFARYSISTALP